MRARINTNLKFSESKRNWAKIYSPFWFVLLKLHQWGHANLSFSRFIIFFLPFFSGCASFYATFSTRILHLLFVIFGTLSSADLVPRWVLYKMWNLSFICLSPQGFMRTSLLNSLNFEKTCWYPEFFKKTNEKIWPTVLWYLRSTCFRSFFGRIESFRN